jgi:hypothetical protein
LASATLGLLVITLSPKVSASEPASSPVPDRPTFILVVGVPGAPEYASNFLHQAGLWQKACAQIDCRQIIIGLTNAPDESQSKAATNDLQTLQGTLASEPKENAGELWLVFIGHGTFDGKEARFNLRGPDVSTSDLAGWLKPFQRPLVLINTASSSAPFLNRLSATNRVIITATRSGNEQNFARFGEYFAEAITAADADLDKDGQVSVLEAFLMASRKVAEFYKMDNRLTTEHALLDDNGDGLGTPADWFHGLRVVKKPQEKAAVDGLLARQICIVRSPAEAMLGPERRAERDALERQILLLRERKEGMPEDDYYRELEKLLLQYARFYQAETPAHSSKQ